MLLGLCFGGEVDDIVRQVITVELVEITGDLLPEQHQRYSLSYYLNCFVRES